MAHIGRPRIVPSPEEMDRLVDEYVSTCRETDAPITLTGLILHLGLSSRSSFDEYQRRPEFSNSVARAKLLIENQYEQKLDQSRPQGAIFALKNFGWRDSRDVEISGGLSSIDVSKLPNWALARIIKGEHPLAVLASGAKQYLAELDAGDPAGEIVQAEVVDELVTEHPKTLGPVIGKLDEDI